MCVRTMYMHCNEKVDNNVPRQMCDRSQFVIDKQLWCHGNETKGVHCTHAR